MKIKKFTCMQCGAPKINPYLSPYIVCDFCGSFTDVDFAVGLEAWNKDPKRTEKYSKAKIEFEQKLAQLLGKGDKENYQKVQYAYWDLYYKIYPEYLPPSVNTEEKYNLYLDVCAISSAEYAFDESWAKKAGEQALLQQAVTYYAKDGKTYADSVAFFKLADFFIGYIKDSFKDFYDNPKYYIMHELLPPDVHLKMKLSMFVQAWIPYLTEQDEKKLLTQTNFNTEYTDVVLPEGDKQSCQHCHHTLFVPKGSYKVYCEHCHKINSIKTVFNCTACGNENTVPDNPAKPVNCSSCGTENRLIQGWF
ncbi:MAG: hypothetical protein KAX69_01420 [Chitinophagales bacterium]|nr:hypothetical protein [Chitinophagales bacterium]